MPLAHAHSVADGAPEQLPAGAGLLLEWTFDPTFLLPLLLAWLYFRGLRAYRRKGGRRFPAWRPVAFAAGLGIVALALLSPIDLLADFSFFWHMVQHMMLTLAGVPLLLLGAPFLPVVWGLPEGIRRRGFVPLAKFPPLRWGVLWVTRPIPGLLLYVFTLWAWHHPTLYNAALAERSVHYLEHLSFMVMAVLFWWNVVTPYPFRSRMHYLIRMAYIFLATVQNSALGALLALSGGVWYAYAALEGFWGLTMAEDQLLGGAMMWFGGVMMHLAALLAVFVVYAREEERNAPVAVIPDPENAPHVTRSPPA
ncbi:MAG: cytochrome c oxidase assembly protein [SAR324 cluster bacterium]|nr:cytochrome c oxidase assembly protein [SAR324 cluster bacterium]